MKAFRSSDWLRAVQLIPNRAILCYHSAHFSLQAFLGLGDGRGDWGEGRKEGNPATIPLNVAFRPHDFGGKINQSEHRRTMKLTKLKSTNVKIKVNKSLL